MNIGNLNIHSRLGPGFFFVLLLMIIGMAMVGIDNAHPLHVRVTMALGAHMKKVALADTVSVLKVNVRRPEDSALSSAHQANVIGRERITNTRQLQITTGQEAQAAAVDGLRRIQSCTG